MRELMAVTKALADENRVRVLLALSGRELCVCQIIAFLKLAPSTVSKHMAILRQAGLVDGRKDGRWMYYRLADRNAAPAVRKAIRWVRESLANDPQAHRVERQLQRILKTNPEELCRRNRK